MTKTIEHNKLYQTGRKLEDEVYELVKALPADEYWKLGNELRRASAGTCHYLMEAHRLFSYLLKLDALARAEREAEAVIKLLAASERYARPGELTDAYRSVIDQSRTLRTYLEAKLAERRQASGLREAA